MGRIESWCSSMNRNLMKEVKEALNNKRQVANLVNALTRMRDRRREAVARFAFKDFAELKEIRRRNRLDVRRNIEKLREAVENSGGFFFLADSPEDACRYIADVVARSSAKLVVKSKSMTSEEIGLNSYLESIGVEVVETDLGERIIQLAGERPSHILAPAVHRDAASIAGLMAENLEPSPKAITRYVREDLRRFFLNADVGISGANVISAEDATVAIVTNEGNERLVSSIPRVYICVAGVEKLVPSMRDALALLRMLVPSATGQVISSYVTFISPRSEGFGRTREFHLVLVDNGRLKALDGLLAETLECIRCSACFNVCPTYRVLGGHVFGHIYTGPIGLPWTAVTHGLEKAYEFSSLCISCGLCKVECPVDIDIPFMISVIKERGNGMYGEAAPLLLRNYDKLIEIGAKMPRLSNLILNSKLGRYVIEKLAGIDSRRKIPPLASENLYSLSRRMGQRIRNPIRKAALFTDYLLMYMFPEIAMAAVKVLNRMGVYCVVPKQGSSGMPLIQYGYLKKASKTARYNISRLLPFVREGYDIVCLEPTAWYCLKEVYPRIVEEKEEAEAVAESSFTFSEYLLLHGFNEPSSGDGLKLAYHWPCHARERNVVKPKSVELLERLGHEVMLADVGCCGMAGTWGMRNGYKGYETSVTIGKTLIESLEKTKAQFFITDSTVCYLQIRELADPRKTLHLYQLLDKPF